MVCALVTGVQTCALPVSRNPTGGPGWRLTLLPRAPTNYRGDQTILWHSPYDRLLYGRWYHLWTCTRRSGRIRTTPRSRHDKGRPFRFNKEKHGARKSVVEGKSVSTGRSRWSQEP